MSEQHYKLLDGGFNLNVQQKGDFLYVDKPWGIATHAPSINHRGLKEYLTERCKLDLYVIHRLDKDTSGALVFAIGKDAAAQASFLIEERSMQKEYCCVTETFDGLPEERVIDLPLKRVGTKMLVASDGKACSTRFEMLKQNERYTLWKVFPEGGRTHQIRVHASELGMPLHGDTLYGGKKAPRLCLHSVSMRVYDASTASDTDLISHTVSLPAWMQDLELLNDKRLFVWLAYAEQRLCLYTPDEREAIRLLHTESSDVRIDRFGSRLLVSLYQDTIPEQIRDTITRYAAVLQCSEWYCRSMFDRGKDPHEKSMMSQSLENRWCVEEHGLDYELRQDQGLSPGLFVDQRRNRFFIGAHAAGKRVLNLFSYTAGFGLISAARGAASVVNVDSSKTTLDWAKDNFARNRCLDDSIEFWSVDARYYMQGAKKRGRLFDIIVIDPPSFSRGKKGVFKISKELAALLQEAYAILAEHGMMLVTTNYEQWDQGRFEKVVQQALPETATFEPMPALEFDVHPHDQEPVLKGIIVRR